MYKKLAFFLVIGSFIAACSGPAYTAAAITARNKFPAAIERARKDKWNMVLHSGVNTYSIYSAELDKARQQLTVQLNQIDSVRGRTADSGRSSSLTPANGAGQAMLHLYMTDSVSYTLDEPHTIPLDRVARIEQMR